MTLGARQAENDILAQLRTIAGVDVFGGEYTPDSYKPQLDANEMFKPYITVKFNPSNQGYDNGIVSPAYDTLRAQFTVYVVSPVDEVTRDLRDQVTTKLVGDFRPTDASKLRPAGGFSFIDPDLGYHRYVEAAQFTYTHNLSS